MTPRSYAKSLSRDKSPTPSGICESMDVTLGPVKCSRHTVSGLVFEFPRSARIPESLQPRVINCLNAHIFNWRGTMPSLADAINQSRIVVADGMSIVWALRLQGCVARERCNMTEAYYAFLHEHTTPTRAVLIGGTQDIAKQASQRIVSLCPAIQIVDVISGYLPIETYPARLKESGSVDVVFLGLGSPKTDLLSVVISKEFPGTIVWHIGGGTILYLADQLPEAPVWARRLGLQWAQRLCTEPRRLWKRYLIGNPLFLWRVLKQRLGLLRLD